MPSVGSVVTMKLYLNIESDKLNCIEYEAI